jgi:hypothetical protein
LAGLSIDPACVALLFFVTMWGLFLALLSPTLPAALAGVLIGLVAGLVHNPTFFSTHPAHLVALLAASLLAAPVLRWWCDKLTTFTTATGSSFRFGNFHVQLDSRFLVVLAFFVLSVALTGHFNELKADGILVNQGFYDAWVASVVFFLFLGITVTLLGLRTPEREPFSSRLSILFSDADQEELEYFRSEILEMGYLSESFERVLTIEDYSSDYRAYLVNVRSTSIIRNRFDDLDHRTVIPVGYAPDGFSRGSRPEVCAQFFSARVGDTETLGQPFLVRDKPAKFNVPLELERGQSKTLYYEYDAWMECGQPQTVVVSRYTHRVSTSLTTHLGPEKGRVCLRRLNPADAQNEELPYGSVISFSGERLVKGGSLALFELLEPNLCEKDDENVSAPTIPLDE